MKRGVVKVDAGLVDLSDGIELRPSLTAVTVAVQVNARRGM